MAKRGGLKRTSKDKWQPQRGWFSASTGNSPRHVSAPLTPKSTYVPAAESLAIEHKSALKQKRPKDHTLAVEQGLKDTLSQQKNKALTPYHSEAWAKELSKHNLSQKYPHLPEDLAQGFDARIPPLLKRPTRHTTTHQSCHFQMHTQKLQRRNLWQVNTSDPFLNVRSRTSSALSSHLRCPWSPSQENLENAMGCIIFSTHTPRHHQSNPSTHQSMLMTTPVHMAHLALSVSSLCAYPPALKCRSVMWQKPIEQSPSNQARKGKERKE